MKKRKRKILWFNPPFSEHVKTNIEKTFLNFLEKHFPSCHCLHKIFNKSTVKISYSCMPNMAAILSRHNKIVLASKNINVHPPCNCQCKAECPLNGNCCKKAILYKASISTDSNNPPKSYYGCCKTKFKSCFYNHRQTFKNKQKGYTIKLSKAFWEALDNERDPDVEWIILARSSTYQPSGARCNLCLDEKLAILLADPPRTLNKRMELTGKCHHKNKFKTKKLLIILTRHQTQFFIIYNFFSFLISHDFYKFILHHLSMTKNPLTFVQLHLLLYLYMI